MEKKTIIERRSEIKKHLDKAGFISFAEIIKDFGVYRASIHSDVKHFNKDEKQERYLVVKKGNQSFIVDKFKRNAQSFEYRAKINAPHKQAIADFVTKLIIGDKSWLNDIFLDEDKADKTDPVDNLGKIYENNLKSKLKEYYNTSTRSIALDSGTTNNQVAQMLTQYDFPVLGSNLDTLSVCTNSTVIFPMLCDSDILIRAISVGGMQIAGTNTMAGEVALSTLRYNEGLRFHMSIIGSCYIDCETKQAFAHKYEDVEMKCEFFNKSFLKIIVADGTKLLTENERFGFTFSNLGDGKIDLLVTTLPFSKMGSEKLTKFKKNIATLMETTSVVVLPVGEEGGEED